MFTQFSSWVAEQNFSLLQFCACYYPILCRVCIISLSTLLSFTLQSMYYISQHIIILYFGEYVLYLSAHYYPLLCRVYIVFLVTGIVGCLNCTQKMKTILNAVQYMEGYYGSLCIVNIQIRIFTFNSLYAHCCSVLLHLTRCMLIVAVSCHI